MERGQRSEGGLEQYDERELRAIRERERFDWFARAIAGRLERYSVEYAEELLGAPVRQLHPGQRERALVILALIGTEAAGRRLMRFEPGGDAQLASFHHVALSRWLARSVR